MGSVRNFAESPTYGPIVSISKFPLQRAINS
jgi:hypothetical protein